MQKVNDLLDLPPLGAEKPSVLMDNILSLWPDATTRETSKLLLGLFLRRLPLQMRSQLANFPATPPTELAADAIWSQSGGQVSAAEVTVVAAVASRPHSPSPRANVGGDRGRAAWPCETAGGSSARRGPRSDTTASNGFCFYHAKFGAKAHKCRGSCLWTPGN